MTTCPYCAHDVAERARVCKSCGAALVRRCPECAEDLPVTASMCPYCGADLRRPAAAVPLSAGPFGEERSVALTLILSILTCGLYGLIVQYFIGRELNEHRGRSELSPGLDFILYFLTCGLWQIYTHYRYAQVLKEICQDERREVQDVTTVCLVLQLCSLVFPGILGLVSLLILQSELNLHWQRHAGE